MRARHEKRCDLRPVTQNQRRPAVVSSHGFQVKISTQCSYSLIVFRVVMSSSLALHYVTLRSLQARRSFISRLDGHILRPSLPEPSESSEQIDNHVQACVQSLKPLSFTLVHGCDIAVIDGRSGRYTSLARIAFKYVPELKLILIERKQSQRLLRAAQGRGAECYY